MMPIITKYSTRMGVLKWSGKEMMVLTEENKLQGSLDKLVLLLEDFTVVDILVINLGASLEIRQRLSSSGVQVFTVDIRPRPWSTLEEASEEVSMNKWKIGSSSFHDDFALEVVKLVEESLEDYVLQVQNIKISN